MSWTGARGFSGVMAEYRRQQLTELLGSNVQINQVPELTDTSLCKAYIVGSCPYDLFKGTKQDVGQCPKLHLQQHIVEYHRRLRKGETFEEFEFEYYQILKSYIQEIDQVIANSYKRSNHTPEERAKIEAMTRDLENMDTTISIMQQEVNYLISKHMPLTSFTHAADLDLFINQRYIMGEKVRRIIEGIGQTSQQKLQACDVCGAFLSRLDSDRRLADHFIGKIHLGYAKMRNDYEVYRAIYGRR